MIRLIFVLCLLTSDKLGAQLCSQNSTGLPPLNDLGTGKFNGYQGGLYPFGRDIRPERHTVAGVRIAESVQPLNANGNVDYANGVTVLLSIGMSNTREEFEAFQSDVLQSHRSPYLRLVNGAQGGKDINDLLDPNTDFWTVVEDSLKRLGMSHEQVQVVWFLEAELGPEGVFPDYAFEIRDKFRQVMNMMIDFYPHLKLCYLSSRIYGDYGDPPLNPEPFAYYNGWSVKFLIEDQMNGDPALRFDGPNPAAPWLSWSAYTWADGENPRSDGLRWICPDDFKPDGNHPSLQGREKVASLLMDFFTTDETTIPWFNDHASPSFRGKEPSGPADTDRVQLYQNYPDPFNPATTIAYFLPNSAFVELGVFTILGERVRTLTEGLQSAGAHSVVFDAEDLPSGIYYCSLRSGNSVRVRKLILLR